MVNGEKMSKEKGNFFTVNEIVSKYSADATRFALAEAGDNIDDANFTEKNADDAILRISTLEMWLKKVLSGPIKKFRKESTNEKITFFDRAFENDIKNLFLLAIKSYEDMRFRDACKFGFHEFHISKEDYLSKKLIYLFFVNFIIYIFFKIKFLNLIIFSNKLMIISNLK